MVHERLQVYHIRYGEGEICFDSLIDLTFHGVVFMFHSNQTELLFSAGKAKVASVIFSLKFEKLTGLLVYWIWLNMWMYRNKKC